MSSIKILPKTFSGGSLKQLPELMKGLAIDNARGAFAQMDLSKLTLDNQIRGVIPFTMTHIDIPKKTDREQVLPETFWNMAGDATEAMQSIAVKVNGVLERFGIEEIANANGHALSINEIKMEYLDETVQVAGENYGGQMKSLRDGLGALANRVSDVLVALGSERLDGNTGGSPKCNQIYPVLETRKGSHPVTLEEIEVFLNDFNMNMSFIVSEWNLLVGVGEPGMTLKTNVNFDEGVMTIPKIVTLDPVTDQVESMDTISWSNCVLAMQAELSVLEMWAGVIADKYAYPYTSQIILAEPPSPDDPHTVEVAVADIPSYEQDEALVGEAAENCYSDVSMICTALAYILSPINHALAMSGNATIIDLNIDVVDPLDDFVMPCKELAELLKTLNKSVACMGRAIETVTSAQISTVSQSLNVIAG